MARKRFAHSAAQRTSLATQGTTPELRAAEMLRAFGEKDKALRFYSQAYEEGGNLSSFLNRVLRSEENQTDGFTQLMRAAGVIVRSIPEQEIYADRLIDVDDDPAVRALLPEMFARMWRGVSHQRTAPYLSTDAVPGTSLNQFVYPNQVRAPQIAAAIPLSEIVGMTTGINAQVYKPYYMLDVADDQTMKRVTEAGEIPRTKLVGGERTIQLSKYGRALEASYESLRRMPLDQVAWYIARLAVQTEKDKVVKAMNILINGDGNANTAATTHNLTTLDASASAGTLTVRGWFAYKMKWETPYMLTTLLAQDASVLSLLLLNTGTANIPLMSLGTILSSQQLTPINPGLADGVRYGWLSDAPSLKFVGFDKRFALERVYEIGGTINEMARWIERQVEIFTMTEVEGYDIFDQKATKILNINA